MIGVFFGERYLVAIDVCGDLEYIKQCNAPFEVFRRLCLHAVQARVARQG